MFVLNNFLKFLIDHRLKGSITETCQEAGCKLISTRVPCDVFLIPLGLVICNSLHTDKMICISLMNLYCMDFSLLPNSLAFFSE